MIKKLLLPALVGFFAFTIASCDSDPCADLEGKCGSGTCFEGACVCDEGFEADAEGICNVEWSAKFVGSYLGFDKVTASTSGNATGNYNLTAPAVITKKSSAPATTINITNFGGFGSFIDATIVKAAAEESATGIEFNYTDPAGRKFVGTGSISGSKITGSYRVTFTDNTYDDVTFEYTK